MAVWTHLAHDSLSLPATTVTWSSISGSYDHLCIKASIRSDKGSLIDYIQPTLNGDTGSNYSYTELFTGTATPVTYRGTGASFMGYWPINGDTTLADTFSAVECWIPNYSNTANFKQLFAKTATENNSIADNEWTLWVAAGLWSSTSAITSIEFVNSGDDFMAHSVFDLYGILGA
tara:strand:+ start:1164 stop:1688 length:525 start_codon:yes stop_codon:yes gene_type:complete